VDAVLNLHAPPCSPTQIFLGHYPDEFSKVHRGQFLFLSLPIFLGMTKVQIRQVMEGGRFFARMAPAHFEGGGKALYAHLAR